MGWICKFWHSLGGRSPIKNWRREMKLRIYLLYVLPFCIQKFTGRGFRQISTLACLREGGGSHWIVYIDPVELYIFRLFEFSRNFLTKISYFMHTS